MAAFGHSALGNKQQIDYFIECEKQFVTLSHCFGNHSNRVHSFFLFARPVLLYTFITTSERSRIMVHGQASGMGLSIQFGSAKLKQQPSQRNIGTHSNYKILYLLLKRIENISGVFGWSTILAPAYSPSLSKTILFTLFFEPKRIHFWLYQGFKNACIDLEIYFNICGDSRSTD